MTLTNESLADLRLFNARAEKLYASNFTKQMFNGTHVSHDFVTGEVKRDLPPEESMEACVLALRMFLQKKDRISLANVARIYREEAPPAEIAGDFFGTNTKVESLLAQSTGITIDGATISANDLVRVFLYGKLAHVDPKYEARYNAWARFPPALLILEAQFYNVLKQLIIGMVVIRNINLRWMAEPHT